MTLSWQLRRPRFGRAAVVCDSMQQHVVVVRLLDGMLPVLLSEPWVTPRLFAQCRVCDFVDQATDQPVIDNAKQRRVVGVLLTDK